MKRLKRIMIYPDIHWPYQSVAALAAAMAVQKALDPDEIWILGDAGDFYPVSFHSKDPRRAGMILEEADIVHDGLKAIRRISPTAKIIYFQGNHEYRLDRYIAEKAPALTGITDWKKLLRLEELDITTVPYKRSMRLGKINVTHDYGQAGQNAHRQAAVACMGSVVIGHTHRLAYDVVGRLDSTPYVAAMFGWLGDPDQVEYVHRTKAYQWPHGCGVGYREENGITHLQPIPIVNGRACFNGKLYGAR